MRNVLWFICLQWCFFLWYFGIYVKFMIHFEQKHKYFHFQSINNKSVISYVWWFWEKIIKKNKRMVNLEWNWKILPWFFFMILKLLNVCLIFNCTLNGNSFIYQKTSENRYLFLYYCYVCVYVFRLGCKTFPLP